MEETNIRVKLLLSAPVSHRTSLKHGLHPSHTASQFSARFSIWSNAFCTVCRLTVRLVSCSVLFFHFSSAYNCFPWEDCTEGNVAVACIVLALFSAPNPSPHWPGMCVSGAIFWLACGNSDLYVFCVMIMVTTFWSLFAWRVEGEESSCSVTLLSDQQTHSGLSWIWWYLSDRSNPLSYVTGRTLVFLE